MQPHNSNTDSNSDTNTDSDTDSINIIDKIVESDDDDDYDDEIILVSSTRERWEKLHGIDPRNKKFKHDDENNNDIGIGLVHPDNGDEDDIMVVAVKPTPTRYRGKNSTSTNYYLREFLFTGIAALSIWVLTTRRLARKLGPTKKGKLDDIHNATFLSTRSTTASEDDKDAATQEGKNTIENNGTSSGHGEDGSSECYSDDPFQKRRASSPQNSSKIIAEVGGVSQPPPTMLSSWNLPERNNNSTIEIQTQNPKTQTEKKLEMARQVAQDIRLVQEVLVEHSLDPSLAPQLAMSLQSSQHIVESQRSMFYQTAMLDAHQRHLDRQHSEQRHRERLKGARYDPNWNEKLQKTRDQCYYWNTSNGGVSRLWWEILLIQQLARGVVPVWQRYFYDYFFRQHFHSGSSSSTHMGIGGPNNHEIGLSTTSFLKDTVVSVLAQVCDCESPGTSATRKGTESAITTSTTSWMISAVASPILSFNIDIGDAVSSFFLVLTSVLKQVLPAPIEYWTCYGYCIILASTVLFFTIVFHQGLRILSLPPFLHHVVNISSMASFYGLQRTLNLFFATLMRMVMVVPTTSTMDYRYASYNTNIASDELGQEKEQENNNRSSLIGCSILLLSLWVFMPLWSWKRTSTLYHEATLRVTRADPVNFEASFRNGTSQLKQWHREQRAIRYLFLSMYSALVFWENCHNIK
jgi:hypothetical protein